MIPLFPFVISTLAFFALGSIFGSFLNVVVYRTIAGESWIHGRSRCDTCGYQLRWFDNIPIFSYLFLAGKCRECKSSISLSHPVMEIISGSLFVWWYWFGAFFFQLTQTPFQVLQPLFWLVVGMILLMIFVADTMYYLIPDVLVGTLLTITLAYRIALVLSGQMQTSDFAFSILAALLASTFFAALWLGTKGQGMGFGDVKLVFPLALLVGWHQTFLALFLAFILGALVGIVLLMIGKKKLGQVIPFGPFLIAGTIITLLVGENLLQWYWAFLV